MFFSDVNSLTVVSKSDGWNDCQTAAEEGQWIADSQIKIVKFAISFDVVACMYRDAVRIEEIAILNVEVLFCSSFFR